MTTRKRLAASKRRKTQRLVLDRHNEARLERESLLHLETSHTEMMILLSLAIACYLIVGILTTESGFPPYLVP